MITPETTPPLIPTNPATAPDKERLACYDVAAKPQTPVAIIEKTQAARAQYADAIRRMFLSNGISMDVFWPEQYDKKSLDNPAFRHLYPRLYIFGYLNNAFVYQATTTGKVLENAKAVGFKGVEFYSKGSDGMWLFDVSGASLPRCDVGKRLCL